MCSALPVFLTGALGVQLRDDLGITATTIGLAMGVSFGVAALLSAPMGRLAQRLGPRRAVRSGLATTALVVVAIAALADSGPKLAALLGVAGAANALNQPSLNLLLATHVDPQRMGFAFAVKQSGMPAAALVGGVAVPAVALTVGWEWAYAGAGAVAFVVLMLLPADRSDAAVPTTSSSGKAAKPDMRTSLLALYATVGFLGATNAGAMVGFITSGAEESGLSPGIAGLVLSFGSATGIASRLYQGWRVDRSGMLPIQRLILLYFVGGLGALLLAVDVPITYLLAPIPAFAFGWAWPGLFNLSVIRNNPSAPGAATGITQVGVFIGAAAGPALGGVIVDAGGYRWLWTTGAALLFIGSVLATLLRREIRASRVESERVAS
jgi:predicted MFS family arabinose efflux permease